MWLVSQPHPEAIQSRCGPCLACAPWLGRPQCRGGLGWGAVPGGAADDLPLRLEVAWQVDACGLSSTYQLAQLDGSRGSRGLIRRPDRTHMLLLAP